ncbi:putative polysaccharide biosynthesis protein [Sutcliffiella halmapala]|uniref:putative polysaccharide biosynthesis protein n=1 Tax=Sutcliffiella halmapala TaxID=79882 RepID=UPI000995B79D|nr:polysaccharide biosynthesis protein [Sutcliffiella halmapala]
MDHQADRHLQAVWKGAMILTVAGIVTKILSAVYRVPFQNIVGDVGFYIYQQVYPFYGVAIILSTYGFPVVISKLIAEQPEKYRMQAAQKIGQVSLSLLLVFGIFLFTLLFLGADWFAGIMGDKELANLFRIVAFSFLLLPFVSVWRGMFQGDGEMTPTAVSQVSEQLIRVCIILLLAYLLVRNDRSLYDVGAGAMLGSIAGGFAAVMVLLFYYQRMKKRNNQKNYDEYLLSFKTIGCALIFQGFTICISSLLLILFQMVDSFTIYAWLVESGTSSEMAKQVKGVYDRGQPLIQLGTVVATAFSLSLVPFITQAKGNKLNREIKDKITISIRVSIAIGAAASVGLAWLIQPVNKMLFSNDNGSSVLLILGLSILFSSLSLTAAAILQGLGHTYLPALYVLIGISLKFLCNYLFIPAYGTLGASVSTLLASAVVAGCMLIAIKRKTGIYILEKTYMYPLFISIAVMCVVLFIFLQGSNSVVGASRILAAGQSLIGVLLGGSVFLILLIKNNYFTKKELSFLPLGSKLSKLIK